MSRAAASAGSGRMHMSTMRGGARQQRFGIGRERADIGLLVGELRLLALDHGEPAFERQALRRCRA